MGIVHLGAAPDGTRVAVKLLRPHLLADREGRERLEREVAALRRIRSPRVAECLDADPWGTVPYVVTRFVAGISLAEYVAEYGPLGARQVHHIATGLAEAVAAVHAVGVLHRDIKPSNVLMERDQPVLIDFGLAMATDESRLTYSGWVLGTPAYLAPEVVYGAEPGPAADIHAWAATVAFTCSGRSPYGSGPAVAVLDRVRRGDHDLTGVPPALLPLLVRCLHPDPRQRPDPWQLCRWLAGLDMRDGGHVGATALVAAPGPQVPQQSAWLVRFAATSAIAGLVATGAALLPYVATLVAACLLAALEGRRRVAAARARREQLRGARRRDAAQAAVSWPWHVLAAAPQALLGAGLALAGLVAGIVALVLLGTQVREAALLAGAVFAGCLWWGAGGVVRAPVQALVGAWSRPTLARMALLTVALAGVSAAAVLTFVTGPMWWPVDEAPWFGWSWRR